jgi:hypothetical protein
MKQRLAKIRLLRYNQSAHFEALFYSFLSASMPLLANGRGLKTAQNRIRAVKHHVDELTNFIGAA